MEFKDFKIGHVYTLKHNRRRFCCKAIVNNYPVMVEDITAIPFVLSSTSGWTEEHEWVVLMWGDEHKNSVVVNSEFFPSEQAAINKWVENPLYIGTKQVR